MYEKISSARVRPRPSFSIPTPPWLPITCLSACGSRGSPPSEPPLPCAAFKGVEASQVLTISEVNALLKRYIEGQRQDDPNYQV